MKTVISKRTARNYKQKYTVITNEQITPQERIQFQPAKPYKQLKVPPFSQKCHKSQNVHYLPLRHGAANCCQSQMGSPLDATRQTLKLSLLFFILFTATNSFLTIITFIYEQADLTAIGPANIAIRYMAFILSTIYAPSCRWKIKTQLLVATFAYSFDFAAGLFVPLVSIPLKYAFACLGATVCGLSAGLLWVSQGRYIHLVCEMQGGDSSKLKAKCFGLFSLIYCLSHISAGLITTFGLGLFNVEIYFITITATGLLSVVFCAVFIDDIERSIKPSQLSQPLCVQGPVSPSIASSHQTSPKTTNQAAMQNQEEPSSIRDIFKYYPKMSSILCILVIDGLCYGIHISEITHMIPADTPAEKLNLYAGFCNIALGCGASLGGYASGIIGGRLGGKMSGNIGILMFLLGSMLALVSLEMQQFWLTLISVFCWGLFLFYIEGWLFIICSREFKGRSESFSVNKQLGSITCFLFQIMVMFTDNHFNLEITIGVVAALAIPAFKTLRKLPLPRQAFHDTQTTL